MPNRWYVTIQRGWHVDEEDDEPFGNVRIRIGSEEATGISETVSSGAEDGKTFDLMGREVKSINRKGIYIMNGKKKVRQ
jgi:hypothetical protein